MRDIIKMAEDDPHFALLLLWLCLLTGPLAWAMQLSVAYPFVEWACEQEWMILVHGATLLALALASLATYLSWHNLKLHRTLSRINENPQSSRRGSETESAMPPREFMALAGLIVSSFFMMVIIMQWLPVLILDPCT
jgi:hypothetical protein